MRAEKEGQEPFPILCDQYRDDLYSHGIDPNSGFLISKEDIPHSFLNKNIIFTFDKEGIFEIPQSTKTLVIENNKEFSIFKESNIEVVNHSNENLIKISDADNDLDYQNYLNDPNSKFAKDWANVNEFRLFLDKLEEEIEKKEKLNFFSKFKRVLFKKNLFTN